MGDGVIAELQHEVLHGSFACWMLLDAAGEKITVQQMVSGQQAEPRSECMRSGRSRLHIPCTWAPVTRTVWSLPPLHFFFFFKDIESN